MHLVPHAYVRSKATTRRREDEKASVSNARCIYTHASGNTHKRLRRILTQDTLHTSDNLTQHTLHTSDNWAEETLAHKEKADALQHQLSHALASLKILKHESLPPLTHLKPTFALSLSRSLSFTHTHSLSGSRSEALRETKGRQLYAQRDKETTALRPTPDEALPHQTQRHT